MLAAVLKLVIVLTSAMRAFFRRCCERIPTVYSCVREKRHLQFPRRRVEILDNAQYSNSKNSGHERRSCWRWGHQARPFLIAIIASGSLGGVAVVYTDEASPIQDSGRKKRVVVLGTGWAGISFLKSLDTTLYDVKVVSPRNYFLFTPLLPSVTCGTVETRSITEPIRRIIRQRQKEANFGHAECYHIDAANKRVLCRPLPKIFSKEEEDFILDYDYLVIAVGAQVNTFNTPGVNEYCLFLKEIEDAEKIRERIVDCFESASLPHISQEDKENLLHFVVVGGGPTGVEFAAELHDLIYEDLWHLYPGLGPCVKITLVQSGDHILNMFDHRISDFAEKKFQRDGIEVKTGCRVLKVNEKHIDMKDKSSGEIVQMPYGMVVWSTGIATRPVVSNFMEQIDQKDRRVLATDEWLRVKGCDNTYAMGDCATIEQRSIMEDIAYIFKLADKDNSGTLTVEEFRQAIELVRDRYPQIDIYLKQHHLQSVKNLLDGVDKDVQGELHIEQFKNALACVDSQMKANPATAQVAAQQGEYLAQCFNNLPKSVAEIEGPLRIRGIGRHRFQPFRYKHFGQFAPLGGEQAAAELPGDWVSVGRSTQWLWYSVYASKQVSWRTRALVIFDWTKRFFFGRDSSRM